MPSIEQDPKDYMEIQRKNFKQIQISEKNIQKAEMALQLAQQNHNTGHFLDRAKARLNDAARSLEKAEMGLDANASPTQLNNFQDAQMQLKEVERAIENIKANPTEEQIRQIEQQLQQVETAFAQAQVQQINPTIC